nr:MAG TPA: Sorting nexin-17, P-selectin domain, PROTEIN TRANSPORT-CELL ADHESION.8A [Caudoviricetes sp.]
MIRNKKSDLMCPLKPTSHSGKDCCITNLTSL